MALEGRTDVPHNLTGGKCWRPAGSLRVEYSITEKGASLDDALIPGRPRDEKREKLIAPKKTGA
jgi:hypothetical protein